MIKLLKLYILFLISLISLNCFADLVKIIDEPHDALRIRHEMIKNAQKRIYISYFIFAEDETSMEFLALLREKAREGVEVKVLVDSLFNDIPKYMGTHLALEGVEIRNFNKFNILKFLHGIRYRMHDKMLIVDDEEIILGGRNIEDTYYGRAEKNYDDRDIYIKGETALNATEYYLDLWQADHLVPFKVKKKRNKKYQRKVDEAASLLDTKIEFLQNEKVYFELSTWLQDATEVDTVELAHDAISSIKSSQVGTTERLYNLLENVKESVVIDSPYFIMTDRLEKILRDLIAKGVYVRILTNSLRATDGIFPQAGYLMQRRKIAKIGMDLFEYYADDSFHAKSMVIDGKIAIVGSFNLDPRSENLNTETLAIVFDEHVSTLLRDSMDLKLDFAYQIDEHGNPVGQGRLLPGVGLKKRIVTRLIQYILAPLIKGLL